MSTEKPLSTKTRVYKILLIRFVEGESGGILVDESQKGRMNNRHDRVGRLIKGLAERWQKTETPGSGAEKPRHPSVAFRVQEIKAKIMVKNQ